MKEELSECLHNLGLNASFRGEYEKAKGLLEDAIRLGRDCNHIVWLSYLLWLGHVYFLLGDYEQGLLSLRKCFDLFDQRGSLWGTAFAMSKMGSAADGLGEHAQAMRYHQDALTIFERAGNQAGIGYALSRMSMSAYFLENYPQAVRLGQEGYQIFEKLGYRWGICTSLCRLGFACLSLDETTKAKNYFTTSLQQSRQEQMLPLSLFALAGLASSMAQEGEGKTAIELLRYVQEHPQTPATYLAQAARWFGNVDRTSFQGTSVTATLGGVSKRSMTSFVGPLPDPLKAGVRAKVTSSPRLSPASTSGKRSGREKSPLGRRYA